MFDSAFERWMNTPANPAVTSSEAGTRPISSRLRALIVATPAASLRNPSELEVPHQVHRARLRAELVVEEVRAAIPRHQRGRHARDEERLVEVDASRKLVGKPAVDRDDPLRVGPDEVQLARGQV